MGEIIPNTRWVRRSRTDRDQWRARFARRGLWEAEHEQALREFDRIVADAGSGKSAPKR